VFEGGGLGLGSMVWVGVVGEFGCWGRFWWEVQEEVGGAG
jgi:hypothetical protein